MLKKLTTPLLLGSLVFAAAGCDDPLEPEEHPEAGGVIIFEAGTQNVLAVSVGAQPTPFDNALVVPLGGALEVEILFLDDSDPTNHALAFHPDEDEGESLRVTIANEAIAEVDLQGDNVEFEGIAAGATIASIDLMHAGHPDYESGDLTIAVQ
jgi:hypothetical protein